MSDHMRLIDANKLKLALLEEDVEILQYCFPCKKILKAIDEAETVERKRGKWISMMGHSICNVCGYKGSPILTNYCPNCGARMVTDEVSM